MSELDDFLTPTLDRQVEAERASSTSQTQVGGVPVEPYTLRVTHIFRLEEGEWKIAHRHADYVPMDQTLPSEGSTR